MAPFQAYGRSATSSSHPSCRSLGRKRPETLSHCWDCSLTTANCSVQLASLQFAFAALKLHTHPGPRNEADIEMLRVTRPITQLSHNGRCDRKCPWHSPRSSERYEHVFLPLGTWRSYLRFVRHTTKAVAQGNPPLRSVHLPRTQPSLSHGAQLESVNHSPPSTTHKTIDRK